MHTSLNKIRPEKFKILLKDVVVSALANWDNLGCNKGHTRGKYFYEDGSRCVIGIAFPTDYDIKLDNGTSIEKLVNDGIIETDNINELALLQEEHDWACCKVEPENAKQNLLKHLQVLNQSFIENEQKST